MSPLSVLYVRCFLLAVLTGVIQSRPVVAGPAFTITDLGTLAGGESIGFGINNLGQVTGVSGGRAFLWTPTKPNGVSGTMVDLGTLGGDNSIGNGINDHGQVTGYAQLTSGDYTAHAFLYDGAMHDLQTLGGNYSYGSGINDRGQVAGYSFVAGDGATLAVMYDGELHDLGSLGGPSGEATAINESGQVVGASYTDDTYYHAMLWTPTTPNGDSGAMVDLGTLGGGSSFAHAINDSGHVTGFAAVTGDTAIHAFFYDGTMHDLGTLGGEYSYGRGINANGQVTGYSFLTTDTGEPGQHAFWYTSENGMVDLNSLIDPQLGWELNAGFAINDIGQITGAAWIGGLQHAFLLTPVPEPSTLALLTLGLPLPIWRKLRKR